MLSRLEHKCDSSYELTSQYCNQQQPIKPCIAISHFMMACTFGFREASSKACFARITDFSIVTLIGGNPLSIYASYWPRNPIKSIDESRVVKLPKSQLGSGAIVTQCHGGKGLQRSASNVFAGLVGCVGVRSIAKIKISCSPTGANGQRLWLCTIPSSV